MSAEALKAPVARANNGRWVKGGPSPNPRGGRSHATIVLSEIAAAKTPEAIQTLYELMMGSKNDAVRLAAANSLLDRAHGRPRQSVAIDAPDMNGLHLDALRKLATAGLAGDCIDITPGEPQDG